ncbi:MAG: Holliday junction branch migration protein RuvA [Clostridia bacterium]|nr:Holliday junction branch migration protein RuvA [Clostridia bacterium]
MFAYISGKVAFTAVNYVAVDVHGVGYQVFAPLRVLNTLKKGDSVMFYIHTNVREDAFELFGFLSQEELHIFRSLLSVSGVGPKSALAVLDVLSCEELALAVVTGDDKAIAKAPGIGKKSAQRIILELKDKITNEELVSVSEHTPQTGGTFDEARDALVALGYSAQEAQAALRGVTEDMSLEDMIKAALVQAMKKG